MMEMTYKQHLKNSKEMSMSDRLDNELIALGTFEKKARKLLKEKIGFWRWLFLHNRMRVEIHIAGCLFYSDKIYWENMSAW